MEKTELRTRIQQRLLDFGAEPLKTAALGLFDALGYRSKRVIADGHLPPAQFTANFGADVDHNTGQLFLKDWHAIDLLFQLTDDDVRSPEQLQLIFDSRERYDGAIVESFLFAAIDLVGNYYTRQQLAMMTRAVNGLFPMPVLIVFRHGEAITLSIIRRRVHKRDESKDVLEKVTLIKDIRFREPLRAHIEILQDLALSLLHDEYFFHNFVGLHQAWEKRLDSYALTERFYRDIANWYFWASSHPGIIFPRSVNNEESRSLFLIRLLTRLIFCWFLQEKGLMPRDLFRRRFAEQILRDFASEDGAYYRVVLQNLFFATLNQEADQRGFRKEERFQGRADDRGVTNMYRYADLLRDPDHLLELLRQVPFVNGGLFDCLDRVDTKPEVRGDDFSEEKQNRLCLPNELFFGAEREVDLSDVYGDLRRRSEKVRGLFEILGRYKFTVEENTPLEQDIALDPELLGHVFENLTAAYNEDTRTTARKATGSFYTPREIVSYMVDEALSVYLRNHLSSRFGDGANSDWDARLRALLNATTAQRNPFNPKQTAALIDAIDHIKILDPACGSGAFPMGALQRLVDLLQKLDPDNDLWRDVQHRRAVAETDQAYRIGDHTERKERLDEIEAVFTHNTSDYGRKLFLIENCLYGIDIQPIACQIAKLRFFIALIVDQKVEPDAPNFGVRPLPNLETRIVAADTLNPVKLNDGGQLTMLDLQVRELREKLEEVRHGYFTARTSRKKRHYRERDAELRKQIADQLKGNQLPGVEAARLAAWDPYDQNAHANFFDPAWMFGVPVGTVPLDDTSPPTLRGSFAFVNEAGGQLEMASSRTIESGFDIVIGNPPYVRQEQIKERKSDLKKNYDTFSGTADLYVYFYERAVRLLKLGGVLSFITSNKWYRSAYGEKLRTWLTHNLRLLRLVDFGDAPIFTAIAYPTIVIGERVTSPAQVGDHTLQALTWQPGRKIEAFREIALEESFAMPQRSLPADGWRLEGNVKLKLLQLIRSAGIPLSTYCKNRLYRGILTGLNEGFVIDKDTRDRLIREHPTSATILKPFLKGRDIKRWRVDFGEQFLIKIESSENKKHLWTGLDDSKAESVFAANYPAVYEHLLQYKDRLMARQDQGHHYWELRACAYWNEFEQPKVLIPAITNGTNYAPDVRQFYSNDKTNICIPPSVPYTLAIANSQISWWYSQQVYASKQGGFYEFKPMYVSQLPIPHADGRQQQIVETVANYLIWLNSGQGKLGKAATSILMAAYFEQVLNGLVYELFFTDDLREHKLTLFRYVDEAKLPDLEVIPENERLTQLTEIFERIYDGNHPVRGTLFALRNLEVVRIIEGEA